MSTPTPAATAPHPNELAETVAQLRDTIVATNRKKRHTDQQRTKLKSHADQVAADWLDNHYPRQWQVGTTTTFAVLGAALGVLLGLTLLGTALPVWAAALFAVLGTSVVWLPPIRNQAHIRELPRLRDEQRIRKALHVLIDEFGCDQQQFDDIVGEICQTDTPDDFVNTVEQLTGAAILLPQPISF